MQLHILSFLFQAGKERSNWQKLINCSSLSRNIKNSLFIIKTKVRVCFKHFTDREQTYAHPYPTDNTLNLVVQKISHKKNTLLNNRMESKVNPFQWPYGSVDLVNNQSTPCTISSFSTYSSVHSENNNFYL